MRFDARSVTRRIRFTCYIYSWADEPSECTDDSPDLFRTATGSGAGSGECRPPGWVLDDHARMALAGDFFDRRGHRSAGWIPGPPLETGHHHWHAARPDRR